MVGRIYLILTDSRAPKVLAVTSANRCRRGDTSAISSHLISRLQVSIMILYDLWGPISLIFSSPSSSSFFCLCKPSLLSEVLKQKFPQSGGYFSTRIKSTSSGLIAYLPLNSVQISEVVMITEKRDIQLYATQ